MFKKLIKIMKINSFESIYSNRIYTKSKVFTLLFVVFYLNISISYSKSPYQLTTSNELIIYGIGIANGIAASIPDGELKELTVDEINSLDKNNINVFDRFASYNYSTDIAKVSDILVYTSLIYPAFYFIDDKIREDFTTISVMYTQTLLFSALVPSWGKGLTGRIRPFVYNPNAPIDEKFSSESRRSFFSGHTTVAFSTMVFLSKVYSDYYPDSKYVPYIWGSSLLLATAVGISRIEAGAHYPTDVIVGAVVGSAIGYIIPEIHRINNENMSLSIMPNSVSLVVKF